MSSFGSFKCMTIKKNILQKLGAVAASFVFIAAVLAVRKEFTATSFVGALHNLANFPIIQIIAAFILTILTYFSLVGYDFLALRFIRKPLSRIKTFLTSIAAYSMSNNIGMSFFAGNSVRYRLYSGWGLAAVDIAKIAGFCAFSSILGFMTLSGLALLLHPAIVAAVAPVSHALIRPLGVLLLSLPLGYVFFSATRKKPVRIFRRQFSLPPLQIVLAQFTFSLLNWSLAAATLYALLPVIPGLSFLKFLGICIISQEAGLLSQIPGGLGVFDSALMFLLSPYVPNSVVLQALLLYRGIYYLFPLCTGILILGGQELFRRRNHLRWLGAQAASRLAGALSFAGGIVGLDYLRPLLPAFRGMNPLRLTANSGAPLRRHFNTFSLVVLGGVLLLVSAIPTLDGPLGWLQGMLPLPVLSISHFLMGVAGMGSILFLFGLKRRFDAAYLLTLVLLATAVAFSLFSGQHNDRTIALSIMLGMAVPSRRHFHKKASFFRLTFSFGLALAILIISLCAFL